MVSLLIADDEFNTREGISALIQKSSLPVQVIGKASNGVDALAMAREFLPDIILTDVRMPRMDGIHLSEQVKKFHSGCQIIFISGYSDKEYLKSAISLKVVSYIEKPIDSTELLNALSAALSAVNVARAEQLLHQQHQNILREKIALALLSPQVSDVILKQLSTSYGDFSQCCSFCTLLCKISNETKISKDTVQEQVCTALAQFQLCFLFAQKESDIFVIHMAFPDNSDSEQRLQKTAESLYLSLRAIADIFFAAGSFVSAPDQIYQSYLNAVIGLKRLFFSSYNNIHYFSDADLTEIKAYVPDSHLLSDFTEAMKSGDSAQFMTIVNKHFNSIRKANCSFSINSIKESYYQLLYALSSVCEERGLTSIFFHESDYIWKTVAEKDTLSALHDYLLSKLTLYADELTSKGSSSKLVHQIYHYIDCHFHETDLSINKMAADLHFTPAYLCQIFKSDTGQTLNFYINKTRINKAKELLKTKDCKLQEIALNTGYRNPDHFTRLFKKYVGMTPSEFRKKYIL